MWKSRNPFRNQTYFLPLFLKFAFKRVDSHPKFSYFYHNIPTIQDARMLYKSGLWLRTALKRARAFYMMRRVLLGCIFIFVESARKVGNSRWKTLQNVKCLVLTGISRQILPRGTEDQIASSLVLI